MSGNASIDSGTSHKSHNNNNNNNNKADGSKRKNTNYKEYFIAGGLSGMIARSCIAPLERVKIIYQVQASTTKNNPNNRGGYFHLPAEIYKREGALAFWKGNTAAVARYGCVCYVSCVMYVL